MASKNNLTIRYNIHIDSIHRTRRGKDPESPTEKVLIYIKGRENPEEYDFLVWAAPAKNSLQVFGEDARSCEKLLFGPMVTSYYTTTLVDAVGTMRTSSPVDWWYSNIYSKQDMAVWAQRDSYSVMFGYKGEEYEKGNLPTGNDTKSIRSSIYYQFSQTPPAVSSLQSHLDDHLQRLGTTFREIKTRYRWPYFPRFTQKQIQDGAHWRVLDTQGRHKVWFIGGSVSFESIKSVVEYNQLLVSCMIDPEE